MNELLELKGITAGYEQAVVLRDVNLTIREHDFIGIIGPNGGGKTTLLKVILGLLKPFSGEIVYHVTKQSLFGYLPQNSRFDARFPISVKAFRGTDAAGIPVSSYYFFPEDSYSG